MRKQNLLYATFGFVLGVVCIVSVNWLVELNVNQNDASFVTKQQIDLSDSGTDPTDDGVISKLLSNHPGESRLSMLRAIATSEDDASILQLTELYETSNHDVGLVSAMIPIIVLRSVSEIGFESTLNQASSLSTPLRQSVTERVLAEWGADSPNEALEWILNTNDHFYKGMEYLILSSWAYRDSHGLLANLSLLPLDLRANAEAYALDRLAQIDPQAAIKKLPDYSGTLVERELINQVVKSWAQQDPEAALEWVLGTPLDAQSMANAVAKVFYVLAAEDPESAFERARQIETEYPIHDLSAAVTIFAAATDPVTAESLAERHSSTPHAWIAVGQGYVRQKKWHSVSRIARSIPEEDRYLYWSFVLHSWAMNDPGSLYKNLKSLPSNVVSKGALELLTQDRWFRTLDDQQEAQVKSLLSDVDETAWIALQRAGKNHFSSTIHDGTGIIKTYTNDEVFTALHRYSRWKTDVFP